ncbi:hypothetical protein C4565_00630 [Candidatus Parcubacteria bacterium]|nr:MAG: hypothetical protein C4565_00630 [Candidatus Parcubacteria bacterium]
MDKKKYKYRIEFNTNNFVEVIESNLEPKDFVQCQYDYIGFIKGMWWSDKENPDEYDWYCVTGGILMDQVKCAFNAIQGCYSGDVMKTRTPKDYEEHPDNYIGNLLCNLMLYCKVHGKDFNNELAFARDHFFFEEQETEVRCIKS